LGDYELVYGKNGIAYLHNAIDTHEPVYAVNSKAANTIIKGHAMAKGKLLKNSDLKEINESLIAVAELQCEPRDVFSFVAKTVKGFEVDIGDASNMRVVVEPGRVSIKEHGSETLFYRSRNWAPYPVPATSGDLRRLDKYFPNIKTVDRFLLKIFIAYTLSHAKEDNTAYVILLLIGSQGSGKTFLTRTLSKLLSPSRTGVQMMPLNQRDLMVATQNAHVLFIDNLPAGLTAWQPHMLCIVATGGYLTSRMLYTDDEIVVKSIHCGVVLNSIHGFAGFSDLSQRCLTIHLDDLAEEQRMTEEELSRTLETDLPYIFRGLLELCAQILARLPDVVVTNPERMLDYVRYLAACELIDQVPVGVYQAAYSDNLREGQQDSLAENTLASALIEFTESLSEPWQGEPGRLLSKLEALMPRHITRSGDWPRTPAMLSRHLRSIQTSLKSHEIIVTFGRGEKRWIRIQTTQTTQR
jgi:energy-coupling factor transporter ATP-binding protein EcfA2